MYLERFFQIIFNQPENPADRLIKNKTKETEKVVKEAKIQELLGLNNTQTKTYNKCLTYYLVTQESYKTSYLSKHPIDNEVVLSDDNISEIINENDINNQAIKKLKEEMDTNLKLYPENIFPNARAIQCAANFTSILYLDCEEDYKRDFNEEMEKKAEYLNQFVLLKRL